MILAYPSNRKFLTSKILSTNHKTADQLKNKVVIVMPSIEKNGKMSKFLGHHFMTVPLKSKRNLDGLVFLADWHTKVRLYVKKKFLVGKSLEYKTCYLLKANFFALKIIKRHKSYIIAEYCLEYEKFAYIFCNIPLQSSAKQVRRNIWYDHTFNAHCCTFYQAFL